MKRRLNTSRLEALIAVLLFAASSWWGATYWRLSLKAGRQPQFYQLYFEPAVMIACGHGFVISHPQPKPLEDFLWLRANTFSCDQVAANVDLSTKYLYQGAWRYLMYAVGITWRFTGISWTRLGPLLGALFGLTITAAYGIFRFGMNRWISLAGALALSVSTLHLSNLPHLRDYSKAPFTLATILLLGMLVTRPVRRASVVLLCAAYGVVLGIGYGFRTDLLINIPPILCVLLLFLEGGLRAHLKTKLIGAATVLLAFFVTAWPILGFVNEKGGGQWHVALLGLTRPFDEVLRLQPAPYDLGQVYEDGYVLKTALGYASRVHPEWRNMIFATHEYDLATGRYYREIVSTFPGDMLTRALASTTAITQLPFDWPGPPIGRLAPWLYRPRELVLAAGRGLGPVFITAAILLTSAYDLRLGLFLFFFLLYFGGYPALQFGTRHYFHLEFMTWWAIGFLLQGAIRWPSVALSVRRIGVVVGTAAAVIAVLAGLRFYQEAQARRIFRGYISAPKTPVAVNTTEESGFLRLAGPKDNADVKLLEVDVNRWECGANPSVTFQYDKRQPSNDYTRVVQLGASDAHEPTRVFAPIYASTFQGVLLPRGRPGCVAGIYWRDPAHQPLVLDVTLAPEWEHRPLYQRLSFEPGYGTH